MQSLTKYEVNANGKQGLARSQGRQRADIGGLAVAGTGRMPETLCPSARSARRARRQRRGRPQSGVASAGWKIRLW